MRVEVRSRIRIPGPGVVAVLAILVVATFLRFAGDRASGLRDVYVGAGVHPKLQIDEVMNRFQSDLDTMALLAGKPARPASDVKVSAVFEADANAIEPGAGPAEAVASTDESGRRIVWIIRASGTFASNRGPTTVVGTSDTGYVVIDDASGETIGMGWP